MHAIQSIRLLGAVPTRNLSALVQRRYIMKTTLRFGSLDDVFFALAIFVPVSLLLAGSFVLDAIGTI
jgi:hypothetical protein